MDDPSILILIFTTFNHTTFLSLLYLLFNNSKGFSLARKIFSQNEFLVAGNGEKLRLKLANNPEPVNRLNRAMPEGDLTDSSTDDEIMITPRLWRKLLAASKRRGRKAGKDYSFVVVGQDFKNDTTQPKSSPDYDIMITPRLWRKLLIARKKRGRKAGRDYSFVAVRQDSNKGSEATETKLKVDHTNSSSDYEIMITPRLWRKLLASSRRRRKSGRDYSFVAVGQDVKNVSKPTETKSEEVQAGSSEGANGDYTDSYEAEDVDEEGDDDMDDDDDDDVLITPRLKKKLEAASQNMETTSKAGDYNLGVGKKTALEISADAKRKYFTD